jgi:cytochrome c nitrite reductase small subunit
MNDHFESWIKSSHHAVAVCNDCHTPEGFFPKYFTKASNGFWHSWGFTTGIFPDPLQIKKSNREITQESCRKCHREMVEAIEEDNTKQENLSCVPCHQYVGHQ